MLRMKPCLPALLLLLTILASNVRLADADCLRLTSRCCAFAGGGFGSSSTSKGRSKKKNKKRSRLRVDDTETTKTAPPTQQQALDKWGLPPPTVDDIFPAMPSGTELLPVDKDNYSLTEIQQLLKHHIPLQLKDSFDENGVEKNVLDGREPMKLRLLHRSPPVLAIDNFFTPDECLETVHVAMPPEEDVESALRPVMIESKTFSPLAQSKRTSTSWFCHYRQVPTLLAKARYRLGIPLEQMEEPQIVRYQTGQEFSWHYDQVPPPQLDNGGQRLATLLVYLNTVPSGGGTMFRDLRHRNDNDNDHPLCVQPTQGAALLFFPALANGQPDDRTLHKGQKIARDEKHIIQMWIHQHSYRAAVPPGNSQQDAVEVVQETSRRLGYI